ncbi:phage tail family protein [Clostridium tertium]|uniref:phage tail family protein n=1 Tax=Clostridium tertium TaxID=1559 RepID=UPI00291C417E|nr:phage tail family protein [Clostridium sp.]
MAIIIYKNSENEIIELGNKKPILLEKIEGLSSVKNNIHSTKNISSDGAIISNESLDVKDISIQFCIVSNDILENEQIRAEVLRIFNPKKSGKIIYINSLFEREIDIRIENSPKFSKSLKGKIQRCVIDFIAPIPYLYDIYFSGEEISTWIGGWKFKFKLPFRFKQRGESKKNIVNEGHVETPVEIIFKGPALNPCVINNRTGEFIKVTRELTSDDILYITTEYGNKKVEIENNGVRTNAFNYIDLDSTFFQLKTGDNMIEYTTDNNLEPQSVEIRYRNRYLGV